MWKCKCTVMPCSLGIPIKNTWWAVPQLLLNTRFCSALMHVSRPNHAHSSSDHVKKWSLFLVYPYGGGGCCSAIIRTLLLASIILSSEWLEYSICKWSTVKKYNGMSITVFYFQNWKPLMLNWWFISALLNGSLSLEKETSHWAVKVSY